MPEINPFRRSKVADRLADPLAGITVAEPVLAAPPAPVVDHSRFAVHDPHRFVDHNRFAAPAPPAPTAPPARSANPRRFTATNPAKADRFAQPRDIVILPRQPPGGQLLTITSEEYLECFRAEADTRGVVWYPGEVIDFTDAAVARYRGWGDSKKSSMLYASAINSTGDLLTPDRDPSIPWLESDLWADVMKMAEAFHAELRDNAHWAATGLDVFDLDILQRITGRRHIPFHEDVQKAIEDDPYSGLGAAALDYAVWEVPQQYDVDWACELQKALNQCIEDDGGDRPFTVQHFVLSAGRLHPDTRKVPAEGTRPDCYELYGRYAVTHIEYVADRSFACVGGFRLLYLEPVGIPRRPTFPKRGW
jgi:hypothetical protein